jgi:hypothetical protein
MAYQGSSQSVGFRNRVVADPSKRMREEASLLKQRGDEKTRDMERQASQEIQEMKRVSDIQTANANYELKALSKFSNTLTNFLQEDVASMIKEDREEAIQRGIEQRALNPQATLDEENNVINSVEKVRQLHDKVEKEAQKAPTEEAGARIRSLSKYEKMGWDFATAKEAANGWDAYREAELVSNTTVLLDHDGTPFVLNQYDKDSMEQYDIAVRYLETQYIDENNPAGLTAGVRNTVLTNPILERSARARTQRQQLVNKALAQKGLDGQENIAYNALQGTKGFPSVGKAMLTFLESTAHHYDVLNGDGLGHKSARARFGTLIDSAIKENHERGEVIIEELKKTKLTGHPSGAKTLFELYKDEFDPESIRGKARDARYNDFQKEQADDRMVAKEELDALLPLMANMSPAERIIETRKYANNHPNQRDYIQQLVNYEDLSLPLERSKQKLADLELEYGVGQGGQIPISEAANLHPTVLEEALKNKSVSEYVFGQDSQDTAERAVAGFSKTINGIAGIATTDEIGQKNIDEGIRQATFRMMRDAQELLRQDETGTLTESAAIQMAGDNIHAHIKRVSVDEPDPNDYFYIENGVGFTHIEDRFYDGLTNQHKVLKEAVRLKDKYGRDLTQVNLLGDADMRHHLELTPKGNVTPLMALLAKEAGVPQLEMFQALRKNAGLPEQKVDDQTLKIAQLVDKVPEYKQIVAQDPSPKNFRKLIRELGIIDTRTMMRAVGFQESGGVYNAYNAKAYGHDNPAIGKYQILWSNLNSRANAKFRNKSVGTSWAKEAGLPEKRGVTAFLQDEKYQEQIAEFKFEQYIKEAYKRTDDPDLVIRMVAAAWYGGPGRMDDYDAVNDEVVAGHPNMREYTTKVLSRY